VTTQTPPAPEPAIQVIDGVECTNRAGIALLAGWKPGNSVNVRAGTDTEFPQPIRGQRISREYWYPLEGDHGVDEYLALLAQRAEEKKPPPLKPGNPDDRLGPEEAADAMHIAYSTFRSYQRYSVPIWEGHKAGRPLIPSPDLPGPEWLRGTLAAHQAQRPGPGTGAGRPTKAVAD
jgi:hypothetical protein